MLSKVVDFDLNLVMCECGHWLEWIPEGEEFDGGDPPAWVHPLTSTNCPGMPNWPLFAVDDV